MSNDTALGLLFALLTGIFWGAYLVPSKKVSDNISFITISTLFMFVGSVVFSLLARREIQVNIKVVGWSALAGFIWVLGYITANYSIHYIGLGIGYTIWSGIQVVTALIFGALLFRELGGIRGDAQIVLLGGIIMVIIGVILVGWARSTIP